MGGFVLLTFAFAGMVVIVVDLLGRFISKDTIDYDLEFLWTNFEATREDMRF
jgi:hypothetical protein